MLVHAGFMHDDLGVVVESEGARGFSRIVLLKVLLIYFLLVIPTLCQFLERTGKACGLQSWLTS